jgi:hypothetical protein
MVTGRLLKFMEMKYQGDMQYSAVYPNARIGGLTTARKTIPLSLTHPLRKKLETALLEIGVLAETEKIDWRVKVNGISITKEFKPHAVSRTGKEFYAKLIFDITSILKTPESLRKRRVNVTFKTEGGSHVTIEQVGLLALYPSEEAESRFTFISGALSLKPGEAEEIPIRYPGDSGVLRTILYMPGPEARGSIIIGKTTIPVEGISGIDEIIENIGSLTNTDRLRIVHEDTGVKYYPREMRVSTILISSIKYSEPVIEATRIEVPEIIHNNGVIKVTIANKGEASPDNAIVVLMLLGSIIARKELPCLKPGEEATVEIPVSLPKGQYNVIMRLIWRKLSRTRLTDKSIALNVQ